jgi:hypothetical protein
MVLAAVALVMVRRAGVAVAGSLAGTEDREVHDAQAGTRCSPASRGGHAKRLRERRLGQGRGRRRRGERRGRGPDKVYGNAGDDYLIDAPDDRNVLCGRPGRDDAQVRDFPAVKD